MTKYTPTTETYFILNCNDDDYPVAGALALDKIATEFYGKQYVGQQVGDGGLHDMFSNDSVYEFDFTEEDPDENFWQASGEGGTYANQTYLGYDRAKKETMYHQGHGPEEYWKSLSWSRDPSEQTHPENPRDGEDCYGAVFAHDFQVYRQAPNVRYTIAKLIEAGWLPYGKYLLHVSW